MKLYLGDSVYAKWDGYHIILTTENGLPEDPSNKIYLEEAVIYNLLKMIDTIKQQRRAQHESPN